MPTLAPNKLLITKTVLKGPHDGGSGHRTILFNCSCHTFDEVIGQIVRAVGVSAIEARSLMNIAHHTGQVKVCEGSEERCEKAAEVLGSIGLSVTVIG